ncbi:MAG: flagellar basal body rod C-terminal domain-containing protein, partial [Pseudomonadota bacterium]
EFRSTVVGGQLSLLLDEGVNLEAQAGGPFPASPQTVSGDLGVSLSVVGRPDAGDRFSVNFTRDGNLDNRTGLELSALQTDPFLGEPGATVTQAFASVVQSIGAQAGQTASDLEAASALLEQSEARLAAISGVNLDEEAANLIRYEQGYNAAAQVISVARDIFNTLFNAVS